MISPLDVDLFYGRLTPQTGHIYLRAPRTSALANATLRGTIRGPECKYAQTLATTGTFIDLGAGPTHLARCVLPDPCFWSSKLPHIYTVRWEIVVDEKVVGDGLKLIGLRLLTGRDGDFLLEGKRVVARGADERSLPATPLQEWHERNCLMLVDDPPDDLCFNASYIGVSIWGRIDEGREDFDSRLKQLACFPAVSAIVLNGTNRIRHAREMTPNLLFGIEMGEAVSPHDDVDFQIVDAQKIHAIVRQTTSSKSPIVVRRTEHKAESLAAARSECDRLQAALADLGQFAGYLV